MCCVTEADTDKVANVVTAKGLELTVFLMETALMAKTEAEIRQTLQRQRDSCKKMIQELTA